MSSKARVGVVGGRGAVGQVLMRLLAEHPHVVVEFGDGERTTPEAAAARALDVLILSAPNGIAAAYVEAVEASSHNPVIIDVSSDFRFSPGWEYGLPERRRAAISRAKRIANPGCYATAAQLGLDPFLEIVDGAPTVFGVSGFSGAGTKPSPKNDPVRLADNLLPYDLVDHTHEREISTQLGRAVRFLPHVAPFFVGISATISFSLRRPATGSELTAMARARYAHEPLVRVMEAAPEVRDCRGHHDVTLGGIVVSQDGSHAALVVTIDNLNKGAASQAVQNMNLTLGFSELAGLTVRAPNGATS